MSSTRSFLPDGFGALVTGLRRERVMASPRFKDGKFQNTVPITSPMKPGDQWKTMREFVLGTHGVARRPPGELPIESPLEAWATKRVESGLRVTWLGHSTTVLEIDGVRVLTDPVWGERVSPVTFAGPSRFHPPPVSVEQLPKLDAVLISHDHFDHLDHPTIRAIAHLDVPIVTSLGVGAHLEAWGVRPERIHELDWWDSITIRGARFHAVPARHFSGRGLGTGNMTFWSSWVIETANRKVFFSGDTGLTREYEDVGKKLGPFDLVMLEVGAFHPSWGSIHLGPENALRAHAFLGSGTLMPVHWGTFSLALHAWDEPAETLVKGAAERGVRIVTPRLGRAVEPAHEERVDPWWREVRQRATRSFTALGHSGIAN